MTSVLMQIIKQHQLQTCLRLNCANMFYHSSNGAGAQSKHKSKPTALHDFHVQQGGKMIDFSGWRLPIQYKSLRPSESHIHTRQSSSLFDVSHMLQLKLHGKDRVQFLEKLIVADLKSLKENHCALTLMTNKNGGIIDDTVITNAGDHIYFVCNAGCFEKDLKHLNEQLDKFRDMDVSLEVLENQALLALQGPQSEKVLSRVLNRDFTDLKFMQRVVVSNSSSSSSSSKSNGELIITRCGYTGEDGFEISLPNKDAVDFASLLEMQPGVELAGLAARDTLRLEAGLCLYGNDINEDTTPLEASLLWTVAKPRRTNKNSFIGADLILKQIEEKGDANRRCGLVIESKSIARANYKVYDDNDVEVGVIKSGCIGPSIDNKSIAMAYVDKPLNKIGTKLRVGIRRDKVNAQVVKMPFLPAKYYK